MRVHQICIVKSRQRKIMIHQIFMQATRRFQLYKQQSFKPIHFFLNKNHKMIWWFFGIKESTSSTSSSRRRPYLNNFRQPPYTLQRKCDTDKYDQNFVICKEKIQDGDYYGEKEYRIPLKFYKRYDLNNNDEAIEYILEQRYNFLQKIIVLFTYCQPKQVNHYFRARTFYQKTSKDRKGPLSHQQTPTKEQTDYHSKDI